MFLKLLVCHPFLFRNERKPSELSKLSIVNLEPREKLQKEKFKDANSLIREIWRKSKETRDWSGADVHGRELCDEQARMHTGGRETIRAGEKQVTEKRDTRAVR